MKKELHYYDIFPKVFIINEEAHITIKPLGSHAAFASKVEVTVHSMAHGNHNIYPERNNITGYELATDGDGCLRFSHTFPEESEYCIRILQENKPVVSLSVYALAEDMRGRYPFRGDLHMHTNRSDGQQEPSIVAANYRKAGYDFTVISDHYRYYPSLEAIDAYKNVKLTKPQ